MLTCRWHLGSLLLTGLPPRLPYTGVAGLALWLGPHVYKAVTSHETDDSSASFLSRLSSFVRISLPGLLELSVANIIRTAAVIRGLLIIFLHRPSYPSIVDQLTHSSPSPSNSNSYFNLDFGLFISATLTMCYLVVERYSVCRCVYYKHSIDMCAAYGQRGHAVVERTVLVGYVCERHASHYQQQEPSSSRDGYSDSGYGTASHGSHRHSSRHHRR